MMSACVDETADGKNSPTHNSLSPTMNGVKAIQRINQREVDRDLSGSASWHAQFKDSAYIFIGGLSYDLYEGDIICAFSQYGEVVDINYVRDKKTGKPKGFAFLQYEDQRSTVLAVDNLNGAKLDGRILRVDHVEKYKQPKNEDGTDPDAPSMNVAPQIVGDDSDTDSGSDDLTSLIDPEDPMAEFLLKKLHKERRHAAIKGEKKDKKGKKEKKKRKDRGTEGNSEDERQTKRKGADVDRDRDRDEARKDGNKDRKGASRGRGRDDGRRRSRSPSNNHNRERESRATNEGQSKRSRDDRGDYGGGSSSRKRSREREDMGRDQERKDIGVDRERRNIENGTESSHRLRN